MISIIKFLLVPRGISSPKRNEGVEKRKRSPGSGGDKVDLPKSGDVL